YVDDTIVFLKEPNELQPLLDVRSTDSISSDAKVNRSKVIALSLSGKQQPSRQQMLTTYGVSQCCDRNYTQPTIYLEYPLTNRPL
ncbi:hypothetical protein BY458DRAFT_437381, partial [Sporodiniella umbellata]